LDKSNPRNEGRKGIDMNLEWKSERSTTIKAKIAGIEISVHTYIGCGDALFVSCFPLNIRQQDLCTTDYEKAKAEALRIISDALIPYVSMYGEVTELLTSPAQGVKNK